MSHEVSSHNIYIYGLSLWLIPPLPSHWLCFDGQLPRCSASFTVFMMRSLSIIYQTPGSSSSIYAQSSILSSHDTSIAHSIHFETSEWEQESFRTHSIGVEHSYDRDFYCFLFISNPTSILYAILYVQYISVGHLIAPRPLPACYKAPEWANPTSSLYYITLINDLPRLQ